MREKDYIVIIGSANIDVAGYSHHPLNYADSNPGKIKFTVAWEGISLIIWRYWGKMRLLSAVGGDFMGNHYWRKLINPVFMSINA